MLMGFDGNHFIKRKVHQGRKKTLTIIPSQPEMQKISAKLHSF